MEIQSNAERLADAITHPEGEPTWETCVKAAAELRRLHEENKDLKNAIQTYLEVATERDKLHAENERVKSIARELFAADEAYGCGFYNDDRWLAAYNALRRNI